MSANDWRQTPPPAEFLEAGAPLIDCEDVPECAVCGGREHGPRAVGFDYELLTCRNPWRFVRCAGCGHVRLNPRPAPGTLPAIYPASYYSYSYETAINPLAVKGKAWLDRSKFKRVLAAAGTPRSYLDIGCGNGRFLRLLETYGLAREKIYGLELDAAVAERLAREGYRVFAQRVETTEAIPPGSIDLATMFHVIEHVADPGETLRKISSWLRPGGVLALETPNLDSLDARWFADGYWGGYHIPRHWHLFTPATLTRLLKQCGFEVLETRFTTGHSFWMYSVHHWLRYRLGLRRVARLFDPFIGLPFLIAFTGLDKLRAALGFKTSAMLVLARKPAR
ncbi:MAG: class I SAM-dependent methyltransferase [Elusimicrobia bacterium]|nr:class I SAM-dependent methyltransferase [Elusimicrobiota bacterium]